jgi:hypothetical protein
LSPKFDIKSIIFIIERTIQSSLVYDLLTLLLSKGITVHDFYSSELHHDFASIYLNPDRKTLISKEVFSNQSEVLSSQYDVCDMSTKLKVKVFVMCCLTKVVHIYHTIHILSNVKVKISHQRLLMKSLFHYDLLKNRIELFDVTEWVKRCGLL